MVRHLAGSRQTGPNWRLFLMLGLCVAFWVMVTTAVAEHL